ncbi:SDR family oxidoreductase [Dactylosporangium aurantiacum]|uniref:SDR family oxidoreductase n=1 Tax=Dactylosporangium aurantiacum TaxID=35754 RepID=A0A9Q9MJ25_9ACTN|nr:SDR family oxidoreductase [Dactylosporangium aurantiacum]MDG6108998.1 SDR family NAD(P)-dependent oxidoreductase [Dactylosporangium aurantiacum]UWZ56500.1 SDR family oxidoreductase [Dactylosporangium aurantiacum]
MDIAGKVVVITGAAGGIGAAMARRFAAEGAATLVLADLDGDAAAALAAEIGDAAATRAAGTEARAVAVDVTDENQVAELIAETEERAGRIDLFCANAGITTGAGLEASAETWSRAWAVNVQSHVSSARAVLPGMLERGGGYLLHTCSAAGLLTAVGDAPYAVTKHAAVAFAEWLSITYGARGIKVSALCPQGVDTPMLQDGLAAGHIGAKVTAAGGAVLSAESVAGAVVEGLAAERFLILPHPEVQKYYLHRAGDTDRWLSGMRGLAASLES